MTSELTPVLHDLAQLAEAATADLFRLVCHQQPDRLLQVGTHTLHLCPRCFGLHAGFFFSVLLLRIAMPRRRLSGTWIVASVALGLATGVEWLLEHEGLIAASAGLRFLSAAVSGAGGAMLFLLYRDHRGLAVKDVPEPAVLSLAAGAFLLPFLLGRDDGLYLLLCGTAVLAVLGNAWLLLRTMFSGRRGG